MPLADPLKGHSGLRGLFLGANHGPGRRELVDDLRGPGGERAGLERSARPGREQLDRDRLVEVLESEPVVGSRVEHQEPILERDSPGRARRPTRWHRVI
jgi:hypothetical protein